MIDTVSIAVGTYHDLSDTVDSGKRDGMNARYRVLLQSVFDCQVLVTGASNEESVAADSAVQIRSECPVQWLTEG
jgi:hypothetical protein